MWAIFGLFKIRKEHSTQIEQLQLKLVQGASALSSILYSEVVGSNVSGQQNGVITLSFQCQQQNSNWGASAVLHQ